MIFNLYVLLSKYLINFETKTDIELQELILFQTFNNFKLFILV